MSGLWHVNSINAGFNLLSSHKRLTGTSYSQLTIVSKRRFVITLSLISCSEIVGPVQYCSWSTVQVDWWSVAHNLLDLWCIPLLHFAVCSVTAGIMDSAEFYNVWPYERKGGRGGSPLMLHK